MSKTLLYAIVNNNFHVVICRVLIKFGSVAQLVEQRPEKPCVGGSIPPRATLTSPFIIEYSRTILFIDTMR